MSFCRFVGSFSYAATPCDWPSNVGSAGAYISKILDDMAGMTLFISCTLDSPDTRTMDNAEGTKSDGPEPLYLELENFGRIN